MNRVLRILLRILLAVISLLVWLVLPPVLLLIPRPIKTFWIRLVLCLISPLGIWFSVETYCYIERKYKYSQEDIEYIIGIELPEFDVVNYKEERINTSLVLGHSMEKILEFKNLPSHSFYDELDSLLYRDYNLWKSKEYDAILDSLLKMNDLKWIDYWSEDSIRQNINSAAKSEIFKNHIQSTIYNFDGDIELEIERGCKYAILKYKEIEFRK